MTTTVGSRTASEQLAAFASGLELSDVPDGVVAAAKLHLLDTLGCAIGAAALDIATPARAMVAAAATQGPATVIGDATARPAADAALANGALAHGLDFDDTHAASICHVSVAVAPAALAVAEATGATGGDVLAALVAGNEVVVRIGREASPSYMQQGFHPTSVCGVFGAAAAAARLRGLSVAASADALGIAGSFASGIFAYLQDGSMTKPLHAGWAAHGGVSAAALAAHGATGPHEVVEGRFGVLHAYFGLGGEALDLGLPGAGGEWETPNIAFKPYPACHFVHACVDAVCDLQRENAFVAADVAAVRCFVPAPAVPLVLEPRKAKIAPRTEHDAKFSMQYSVAAMIVHGAVGVTTYIGEAIAEPAVLEVAERVTYEVRDFPTFPAGFPGAVSIELRSGAVLERELPYQRGGVEYPMEVADVTGKFRANALLGLGSDDVAALEETILGLEGIRDLTSALEPLRRVTTTTKAGS